MLTVVDPSDPLPPRHRRFVEEYLVDLNGTRAAIRAGFSERTVAQQATRLLRNVQVQQAIADAQLARSKRTQVTADAVVERLAVVGFADPRDVVRWGPWGVEVHESDDLTPEQAAAVAEMTYRVTKDGAVPPGLRAHHVAPCRTCPRPRCRGRLACGRGSLGCLLCAREAWGDLPPRW